MASIFCISSEELGYAEYRLDAKPPSWATGLWRHLLPASLAAAALAALWWTRPGRVLGVLAPGWVKLALLLLAVYEYVRYLNPLLYESIAVKRGRGLELCTRWARFERAVVLQPAALLAVTVRQAGGRLMLCVKATDGSVYQAFVVRRGMVVVCMCCMVLCACAVRAQAVGSGSERIIVHARPAQRRSAMLRASRPRTHARRIL